MKNNKRLMKVSDWSREELMRLKREMEYIEGREVSMNDVLERMLKGKDIRSRLKRGSLERKYGYR